MSEHAARLAQLGALIESGRPLWRPQPFKAPRPPWCAAFPQLTAELLALDDDAVASLSADNTALLEVLARHLGELRELAPLIALPRQPTVPLRDPGAHFDWAIPGRKRAQIEAFAAAAGPPRAPVVDWCAGKGHLGRFIAAQWGGDVDSIERDPALVAGGAALARRARQTTQQLIIGNVFEAAPAKRLRDRHVVALHACGDLHRQLVRLAALARPAAVDLSPCCYHRTGEDPLSALAAPAALALDRDDLRLAVTDTATAPPSETHRRRRENAWKLGFMTMVSTPGEFNYRPLRPIPAAWLGEDFAGFCRRLAAREGVALPAAAALGGAEADGQARWYAAERLELVRLGYRRALEVWLGLDLAVHLETAGYTVSLGEFCARALTPRNLLLSARRNRSAEIGSA